MIYGRRQSDLGKCFRLIHLWFWFNSGDGQLGAWYEVKVLFHPFGYSLSGRLIG